jgi:lipopolysaccharide/colanic/teichoic acid biosynthesis glycosyltransferase
MALNFLQRIFGNGNRSGSGNDLLLPVDQFRTLILHECARCDRNAHTFSLIHIDMRSNGSDRGQDRGQAARRLSKSLVQRMRTTDEIGWMDGYSVGVFLPETGVDGAQSLARDACQGFSYQVYTYPWLGSVGDDLDGGSFRRGGKDRKGPEARSSDGVEREDQLPTHSEHMNEGGGVDAPNIHFGSGSARCIEELILPERAPSWKRVYDILGSTFLFIVLSPLFAAVALYIKIVSPGQVFFRQERIGYLGRPFNMIKFRTMRMGSDNVTVHQDYLKDLICSDGKVMTKLDTGKDNRLIPLAGILRRCCIDELPQLINVLKGDMSLVGPRPCLDYEAREYALWQRRRFLTVPGMTGLWQVSGKNRLTFKEMMRLDIRYANRKNATMDLMISFKTVPAILGQIRDAVQMKYSTGSIQPEVNSMGRKWSLKHLIRQLFL